MNTIVIAIICLKFTNTHIIKKYILKDEESKNNLKLEMALDKNKYNIMVSY